MRSYHAGGKSTYLHQLLQRLPANRYRATVLTDRPGLALRELGHLCSVEILEGYESPTNAQALRDFLRGRFDLAQSNGFGTALALACHSEGIPHLWRIGVRPDVGIKDFQADQLKGLTACIGVLAERIICPSRFLAEPFLEAASGKVVVIPNAAELGPPPPEVEFTLAPTIAMLAHFFPQKRHADFLDACLEVTKSLPQARFVIYGESYDTRESRDYERWVKQQAPPQCHFDSFQGDPRPHLEKAHIVVLPSIDEGASRAIIQAMACARPVVASASGGNLEMVENGQTGFLVPPKKSEALAKALLELARDPQLANRMGKAGRERAERYFSPRNLDRYVELYDEALAFQARCKT